jgi:Domain of unknown function (DUF1833)
MPSKEYSHAIHAISSVEDPLLLLEFSHAALAKPLCLVNDNEDIVSNGTFYSRSAFKFEIPSTGDKQNPKTGVSIHYTPDLAGLIKKIHGAEGAIINIKQIMRSLPNLIEMQFYFEIGAVTITNEFISFELGFNNLLEKIAVPYQFRPETAEGIFV